MKDVLKPILVLGIICMVVTAMLAFVNMKTQPVIRKAEEQAAAAARSEVLKEAKHFKKLPLDGMPEGVTELYKGDDKGKDAGYVVITEVKGYGGVIRIICGIRTDGTLEALKILSHSETSGVGTKAVDNNSGYRDKFVGTDSGTYSKVDTISGATISSSAVKKGVGLAFEAYGIITEGTV